jgi:hypothetical protein
MHATSHSSARPAAPEIIPVRPAAGSDHSAGTAGRDLLRRTLGRFTPSRRTLGLYHPSRRTLGRTQPSRRTLGRTEP